MRIGGRPPELIKLDCAASSKARVRVEAGSITDETISLTDLMATAAEITGRALPQDAGEDSYSILPVLQGRKLDHARRAPGCPQIQNQERPPADQAHVALHDVDDLGQLVDLGLAEDPAESVNLYDERPDVVERLQRILDTYRETGRSRPLWEAVE